MDNLLLHRRAMMQIAQQQSHGLYVPAGAYTLYHLSNGNNVSDFGVEITFTKTEDTYSSSLFGKSTGASWGLYMGSGRYDDGIYYICMEGYSEPMYSWSNAIELSIGQTYTLRSNYLNDGAYLLDDVDVCGSRTINPTMYDDLGIGCAILYNGDAYTNYGTWIIHDMTITKGSSIQSHLIPQMQNGVAGLYDELNDVFYSSVTDVPFEIV